MTRTGLSALLVLLPIVTDAQPGNANRWLQLHRTHLAAGQLEAAAGDLERARQLCRKLAVNDALRVETELLTLPGLAELPSQHERFFAVLDGLGQLDRSHWPEQLRVEFYLERARGSGLLHDLAAQRKDLDAARSDALSLDSQREVCRARVEFALETRRWSEADNELSWLSQNLGKNPLVLLELQALTARRRGRQAQELQLLSLLARLHSSGLERFQCHLRLRELALGEANTAMVLREDESLKRGLESLPDALGRARAQLQLIQLVKDSDLKPLEQRLAAAPNSPARTQLVIDDLQLRHKRLTTMVFGPLPKRTALLAESLALLDQPTPADPEQAAWLNKARAYIWLFGTATQRLHGLQMFEQVLNLRLSSAVVIEERRESFQDDLSPQSLMNGLASEWFFHQEVAKAAQLCRRVQPSFRTPTARMEGLDWALRVAREERDGIGITRAYRASLDLVGRLEPDEQVEQLDQMQKYGPEAPEKEEARQRLAVLLKQRAESFTAEQAYLEVAASAQLLASLYSERHQRGEAIEAAQAAVRALEQAQQPIAWAGALETLAKYYQEASQPDMALLTLERALTANPDPMAKAQALEKIASLELAQGRPETALKHVREGEKLLGSRDNLTGRMLRAKEGEALVKLGRGPEALLLHEKMRRGMEGEPGEQSGESVDEADLEDELGHTERADQLYREAIGLSLQAYSVPVESARTFAQMLALLHRYKFLKKHGRQEEAFTLALPPLTARLQTAPEMRIVCEGAVAVAEDLCRAGRFEEAKNLLRSAEANPKLGDGVRQSRVLAETKALAPLLNRLGRPNRTGRSAAEQRSDYFQALANVRSARPDGNSNLLLSSTSADLVMARLRPGQMLVAYFPVGPRLYILGLEPGHLHVSSEEVNCDLLEDRCRSWHRQLSSGKAVDPALVHALSSQLLEPIEPWLAASKPQELLVSVSGELWYAPLEMLPLGGSNLAKSCGVARLTPGDLLHLVEGGWHPFQTGPSLAFGAPEAADLPGAQAELEATSHQLPGCQLLTGTLANRERFLGEAPLARLIHLATHSRSDDENPLKGYLQLANGQLTLSDIYGLRLPRSPLVVLSSCCSGLGQSTPGNEPISLATAFSAAGAGTVVSALWPVDDDETRELFGWFYGELARGHKPLQSLQKAQAASRLAHPASNNWAAFVLSGCPD